MDRKSTGNNMVAMQLSTDEGAFICTMTRSDVARIDLKVPGNFIVIHNAIRLDGMYEGRYELHKRKQIETVSIDSYHPLGRNPLYVVPKSKSVNR